MATLLGQTDSEYLTCLPSIHFTISFHWSSRMVLRTRLAAVNQLQTSLDLSPDSMSIVGVFCPVLSLAWGALLRCQGTYRDEKNGISV